MNEAILDEIKYDYILIIEFLNPDEERTGQILIEKFSGTEDHSLFEIEVCANEEEVINVLNEAILNVPTKGVPIIHFEAHGAARTESQPGGIGFNSNENHAGAFISWKVLWPVLRKLNLASDFNLVVVAAACSGDDIAYGLVHDFVENNEPPAPFMGTVGFVEKVSWYTLNASVIVFYEILRKSSNLQAAIIKANEMLGSSEKLAYQWTAEVIWSTLQHFNSDNRSQDADYYWRKFKRENPNSNKTKEEFFLEIVTFEPEAKKHFLSKIFYFEKFPHNRERWKNLLK